MLKKNPKFDDNFDIQRQLEHFKEMNRTLSSKKEDDHRILQKCNKNSAQIILDMIRDFIINDAADNKFCL